MSDTAPSASRAFEVKQFIDTSQMRRDLSFSPADLTNAMMEQAALFAHYGVLAAQASRQVDVLKLLLEQAEAAVYRKLRDEAAVNSEKVTEAQLEKLVSRHQKVISLKRALNEARQIESVGKTAVEAFRHRRDMLVQHGLISREEMKGELAIAAKSAHEQALDEQKANFLERRRARQEGRSEAEVA